MRIFVFSFVKFLSKSRGFTLTQNTTCDIFIRREGLLELDTEFVNVELCRATYEGHGDNF